MKFREAWRISNLTYTEIAFQSIQTGRSPGQNLVSEAGQTKEFALRIRTAKISKVAFAIFGMIGSTLPFLGFFPYPGPETLVSGISLSLAISLAYIVFYSLQILPSFPNSNSFAMLSTLPIGERDFSLVATLSFVRTFDYLIVGCTILQVALVWLITENVLAALFMLLGAFTSIVFGIAIALWFSRVFYKNVTRGGRSKRAGFGRILFLITWGFAALSIGFIFNFISYLLPFLNAAIGSNSVQPSGLFLALIHPFGVGLAIANVVYPSLFSPQPAIPGTGIAYSPLPFFLLPLFTYASLAFYFALSLFLGRRTFHSVTEITRAGTLKVSRENTHDYRLKVRSPLLAYAFKDMRSVAKNPSVAFMYALPLFIVFLLAIVAEQFPVMRASAVIASTVIGCSFTLLISSTLLNSDKADQEYTTSLPVNLRDLIGSKALVATLTFIPVPIALFVIAITKQLTSSFSLLIPFIEIPTMYAACLAMITLFMAIEPRGVDRGLGRSRGFSFMAASDIIRLMESLAVSLILVLIPLAGYSIEFLQSSNYLLSLVTMLFLSAGEVFIVQSLNRRFTTLPHVSRKS